LEKSENSGKKSRAPYGGELLEWPDSIRAFQEQKTLMDKQAS
jgi:hypothetical protein